MNKNMNTFKCKKLKKPATRMENPPIPGDLGLKIQNSISAEAWEMWLDTQTKIINEQRLLPINPEHKKILINEMQKFLFENNN